MQEEEDEKRRGRKKNRSRRESQKAMGKCGAAEIEEVPVKMRVDSNQFSLHFIPHIIHSPFPYTLFIPYFQ